MPNFSFSELDTKRQCKLKWQLAYEELWQPPSLAPALTLGTLFHSVLELHYNLLKAARAKGTLDHPEIKAALIRAVMSSGLLYDPESGEQTEEQAQVEWMYRGYVDYFGNDRLWKIVAVEAPFNIWLPNARGNRTRFRLAGTADLIVEDLQYGGLWIVDHKTCKYLPRRDADFEDQMALYVVGHRFRGLDIRGGIYNYVRKDRPKTRDLEPDERFKREFTVRTDRELQNMVDEAVDHMREVYRKRRGDFPRSPNGDTCQWKCQFKEACLAGRKRGPDALREFLSDLGFVRGRHKPGPTYAKLAELEGRSGS